MCNNSTVLLLAVSTLPGYPVFSSLSWSPVYVQTLINPYTPEIPAQVPGPKNRHSLEHFKCVDCSKMRWICEPLEAQAPQREKGSLLFNSLTRCGKTLSPAFFFFLYTYWECKGLMYRYDSGWVIVSYLVIHGEGGIHNNTLSYQLHTYTRLFDLGSGRFLWPSPWGVPTELL